MSNVEYSGYLLDKIIIIFFDKNKLILIMYHVLIWIHHLKFTNFKSFFGFRKKGIHNVYLNTFFEKFKKSIHIEKMKHINNISVCV